MLFYKVVIKQADIYKNVKSRETVDYPVSYVPLDKKGDMLGQLLANLVAKLMNTKQPGRIGTRQSANGEYYGVLRGAASVGVTAIILEHSFHTNAAATGGEIFIPMLPFIIFGYWLSSPSKKRF